MNLKDGSKFPRVVIIGGGFGGLQVAKKLGDKPVEVLMVDKHNYHTFQPLLYQVATGSLEADSIAFSLRKNFSDQKNFRYRNAEVTKINPEKNTIDTTIGELPYDYLVIATGSTTNFFGNKDIEHFAMPMKSIPEALNLRSLILQNIEEAVLLNTKEDREPYLNFVLVGAGPTGVELAGALAELRNNILTCDYPELEKEHMSVYLVDFLPRVLGAMSQEASKGATDFLTKMGVDVLTGVKVESYDGSVIKFEGGRSIRTKNVIWSAGVMGVVPAGINKNIIERGNRIRTDSVCRVAGFSNVFAIGDVAAMITDETPKGHPGVAQVAIQMGNHTAKTIIQLINNEPTEPFKYFDKGSLATIGRNKAVADLGKLKFQGFFAWMIWMFVHLISLLGFRNKIVVFINWVGSYLTYNGGARLIIRRYVTEAIPEKTAYLPKTDG
ncbi:NAD(P)/FAD-dependent oxidoreductase [Mucilaginibacter gotjawali]|uniref:NADH:ubiquinone reductase (non-electrogenic) n=2 Tax=Mucilaginibacter gotjawali TaxID=1550579 RepID=A0A110B3P5_9SPHI|nr:NAD(P)/FAD-dependent oxidoreductase [Mucilaginibacter gotjawali]MBB3057610.1 NADH dehydrogenase [Mucilaginibacter gotjawali]BAU55272.1 NADH dehydrogenase-like protein [Mucilaginibacter gotjawali]